MQKVKSFRERVKARLGELPPRYPQGDARNYDRIQAMVKIEKEESAAGRHGLKISRRPRK